jgi:TonB family protein
LRKKVICAFLISLFLLLLAFTYLNIDYRRAAANSLRRVVKSLPGVAPQVKEKPIGRSKSIEGATFPEEPVVVAITTHEQLSEPLIKVSYKVSYDEAQNLPLPLEYISDFAVDMLYDDPTRTFIVKVDREIPQDFVDTVIAHLRSVRVEKIVLLTQREDGEYVGEGYVPPPPETGVESGIPEETPGPLRVGGDVKAPVRITYVPPVYPELARRARIQGIAIVEAIIDKEGKVVDARVIESPGRAFGFDDAALKAVNQWKFKPATFKGKPVDVYFNLTITFELH